MSENFGNIFYKKFPKKKWKKKNKRGRIKGN